MPIYFWNDPDGERYREATSTCTRASGATATGSRSPSAAPRSSRPLGLDDQPRRHPHGHGGDLPRGARASTTSPTRSSSTSRRRARRTGCRCSSSCARARELDDELVDGDPRAHPRGLLAAPRARTRSSTVDEVPRTLSGKVLELPVKRILHGRRRRRRRRAATRSPTRRRWTSSSSTPGAAEHAGDPGRQPPVGRQPGAGEDQQQAGDRARAGPLAEHGHAERERDDRVDVGDHERPARADLGDQAAEDHERRGRAEQAEHDDATAARRSRASRSGSPTSVTGVRNTAAIASETPITARWSRSERWRRRTIGPAA